MNSRVCVGSRVRRTFQNSDGATQTECGVVVHIWNDPETGDDDAYIAFFGDHFPDGKPASKPYVLRYFVASLELVA
jgi:hypothetical protein